LETQRAELEAEAARRGFTDTEVIVDAGISAKNTKRPELQRALRMLRDGEASVFMATKLDRISRSTKDVLELAELAKAQGWKMIVTAGDLQLDTTTAYGEMILTTLAMLATFERRMIQERVTSGIEARRLEGDPRGYVQPELEARIVEMYRAGGTSMGKIAARLNAEAVPTARGGVWAPVTVKRVLDRHERKTAKAGAKV
jgi:DNA invertase Pin-like site-specific DNA recombinase